MSGAVLNENEVKVLKAIEPEYEYLLIVVADRAGLGPFAVGDALGSLKRKKLIAFEGRGNLKSVYLTEAGETRFAELVEGCVVSAAEPLDSALDKALVEFDAMIVAARAWHRARGDFDSSVSPASKKDAAEIRRTYELLIAAEDRLSRALEEMDR